MKFEDYYIALREKEGRILSNKEISSLPNLPKNHPLFNEWEIRKKTLNRLSTYLKRDKKAVEIGCGNGWFSNWLLQFYDDVIGIDVNRYELNQASLIFTDSHLTFKYVDDVMSYFERERPNAVFFNASLQYFNPQERILDKLLKVLPKGCEIHILDTPVYIKPKHTIAAKERSDAYYADQGFTEMRDYYFHYALEDFPKIQWVYTPKKGIQKLLVKDQSPFPWGIILV